MTVALWIEVIFQLMSFSLKLLKYMNAAKNNSPKEKLRKLKQFNAALVAAEKGDSSELETMFSILSDELFSLDTARSPGSKPRTPLPIDSCGAAGLSLESLRYIQYVNPESVSLVFLLSSFSIE